MYLIWVKARSYMRERTVSKVIPEMSYYKKQKGARSHGLKAELASSLRLWYSGLRIVVAARNKLKVGGF